MAAKMASYLVGDYYGRTIEDKIDYARRYITALVETRQARGFTLEPEYNDTNLDPLTGDINEESIDAMSDDDAMDSVSVCSGPGNGSSHQPVPPLVLPSAAFC